MESKPFITIDEDGMLILEYWKGKDKLTLFGDGGYLISCGPNVNTDMMDGKLTDHTLKEILLQFES